MHRIKRDCEKDIRRLVRLKAQYTLSFLSYIYVAASFQYNKICLLEKKTQSKNEYNKTLQTGMSDIN